LVKSRNKKYKEQCLGCFSHNHFLFLQLEL
jgi:hypothetical protein